MSREVEVSLGDRGGRWTAKEGVVGVPAPLGGPRMVSRAADEVLMSSRVNERKGENVEKARSVADDEDGVCAARVRNQFVVVRALAPSATERCLECWDGQ